MGVNDYRVELVLMSYGLSKNIASKLAEQLEKKYKGNTYLNIVETPHILVFHGIDFAVVETTKIYQYEPTRIYALLYTAYGMFASAGHTKVSVHDLIIMSQRIEKKAGVYSGTPPLIFGRSILNNFKVVGLDVYSKHIYYSENHIAKNLKSINKSTTISCSEDIISEVEKELNIKYDDTQKQAFGILSHRLGILTGGPGTGKTTVLKGIISAYKKLSNMPIVCCAPTGKAAERMREATGLEAETIHRTLGIRPYQKGGYKAETPLPKCLLIVDEVSMLDTELADTLFASVSVSGSSLILVGDEEQLQSVGPGAVLRDIIACGKFYTVRLGTIHRQDSGSIIDNAYNVKIGKIGFKCNGIAINNFYEFLDLDTGFVAYRFFDDDRLVKNVLGIHKQMFDKSEPLGIRIFTPVRSAKYTTSTAYINERLHEEYHPNEEELKIGCRVFSVGEPVIITRNDYDNGVLNGDEGVVVDLPKEIVTDKNGNPVIDKETGKPIERISGLGVNINNEYHYLTGEILNFVELGYATTIHKAQGSSCKVAIIVVPDKPRVMLTRRLLYVAVTRAEKKVVILHEGEALESAIRNDNETVRRTGLLEKLGVKKCSKNH